MRHGYFGKKFSRTKNERQQLFRSLAHSLISAGQMKTTLVRAKVIRAYMDTLITHAKRATDADIRQLGKKLANSTDISILLSWAKTRFANRSSGFTTFTRLGPRRGDNSEEVLVTFMDPVPAEVAVQPTKATPVSKTAASKKPENKTIHTPKKKTVKSASLKKTAKKRAKK